MYSWEVNFITCSQLEEDPSLKGETKTLMWASENMVYVHRFRQSHVNCNMKSADFTDYIL
jgi:hypothetical protein